MCLVSPEDVKPIAQKFSNHIILKRIESSFNRSEEIVSLMDTGVVPMAVKPAVPDPWQWQRFVEENEFSVWYICIGGRVTFAGCYRSAPVLVEFGGVPVPRDVDVPFRKLISELKLTGQFAFDFIRERKTGDPYVIKCSPRSSSVLEQSLEHLCGQRHYSGLISCREPSQQTLGFFSTKTAGPGQQKSTGTSISMILCGSSAVSLFGLSWPLERED